MRQLSRLTLELKKLDNEINSLQKALNPKLFDKIILATKSVCAMKRKMFKRPEFTIPSLALKIGYALKKFILQNRVPVFTFYQI